MIFGWPTDWLTTIACVAIFGLISAGGLVWDRGTAMVKSVIVHGAIMVGSVLLVPAPWNLPVYLVSLVGGLALTMRRRVGQLVDIEVAIVDRPAVPTHVARVVDEFEALGFGAPRYVALVVRGSPAYRAVLLDPSATMRAVVSFMPSLQRPQGVHVGSGFGVGSLSTIDRGPGVDTENEVCQLVDSGSADELLRAHEAALAAVAERDLRPVTLDEVPEAATLQTDIRRRAQELARSPLKRSWQIFLAGRQSKWRTSNPIPPITSPHDSRVRKLVAMQTADR